MPITANAPYFIGGGRIEFRPRVYPDPGPGELLLRVEADAVCGTDRELYFEGSECIPGHEGAGVVIAAGPATSTPIGTRGVVYLMDYCGECRSCRLGATNQCLAKRNDMGFTADGAYGPYEVVHESNFFVVPPEIDGVEATLLLDVMGTGGHALRRLARMRDDVESLYVVGAGPVGLGVVAMARARLGADIPVYVSDFSGWRLELAGRLGGVPIDLTRPEALRRMGQVDAAVDTTGKSVARRAALDALSKRGVLVCVGHGEGLELTVSSDLIATERTVMGSEYFTFGEMADNLATLQAHRDLFGAIITHRVRRDEIVRGFDLFLSGQTGKVVVVGDAA